MFVLTLLLIAILIAVWIILKVTGDFTCLVNPIKGISVGVIYENEREEDGSITHFIQIVIWFASFTFVFNINNKEDEL